MRSPILYSCADDGISLQRPLPPQVRQPRRWSSLRSPRPAPNWKTGDNKVCVQSPSAPIASVAVSAGSLSCALAPVFCVCAPRRPSITYSKPGEVLWRRQSCPAVYRAGCVSQPDFLARTGAGNLLLFFNSVIPEATRIIAPVVEKYGFPATQEGE